MWYKPATCDMLWRGGKYALSRYIGLKKPNMDTTLMRPSGASLSLSFSYEGYCTSPAGKPERDPLVRHWRGRIHLPAAHTRKVGHVPLERHAGRGRDALGLAVLQNLLFFVCPCHAHVVGRLVLQDQRVTSSYKKIPSSIVKSGRNTTIRSRWCLYVPCVVDIAERVPVGS
jgi:hypothetical protein